MKKPNKEKAPSLSKQKDWPFFGTDSAGNLLFYPWAIPGEAVYVNEQQKKKITIFLCLLLILFSGGALIAILNHFTGYADFRDLTYSLAKLFLIFPLIYIFSMYLFCRKKQFYSVPKAERQSKNVGQILVLIAFFGVSAVAAFSSDSSMPRSVSMFYAVLSAICTASVIGFVFIIKKNMGYFFSKKTK